MKKMLALVSILAASACATKAQTPPARAAAAEPAAPAEAPPSAVERSAPPMSDEVPLAVSTQVELLRSDVRLQKKAIVAQAMQLTESEAKAFWPIYDGYQAARSRIFDRRLDLVKAYAASFETMTPAEAARITKQNFVLDDDLRKLQDATFQKLAKATSAQTAARWVQVDRQLEALLTLQVSRALPLMPKPASPSK